MTCLEVVAVTSWFLLAAACFAVEGLIRAKGWRDADLD